MNKELRTINDFKINWGSGGGQGIKLSDNQIRELKQEAIKWVKAWKDKLSKKVWKRIKENCLFVNPQNIKENNDYKLIGSIVAFVNFFNITEEDLK